MAVAAAIGVGGVGDEDLNARGGDRSSRLNRKQQQQQASPPAASSSELGEINRSIEKMSLGGCQAAPSSSGLEPSPAAAAGAPVPRRGSNWTVESTEGYGSMRSSSDQQSGAVSRRASELSAMSQARNSKAY